MLMIFTLASSERWDSGQESFPLFQNSGSVTLRKPIINWEHILFSSQMSKNS